MLVCDYFNISTYILYLENRINSLKAHFSKLFKTSLCLYN